MIDGVSSCSSSTATQLKQAILEQIQKPDEVHPGQPEQGQEPGPAIAGSMYLLDILA